jgi:hypothetical protein
MSSRWAQKMAARQAAGQCRHCEAPQAPGRALCERHLQIERDRKRAKDARRKEQGLCVEAGCPHKPANGHIRCAGCHARFLGHNLAWQREHRVKGDQG